MIIFIDKTYINLTQMELIYCKELAVSTDVTGWSCN